MQCSYLISSLIFKAIISNKLEISYHNNYVASHGGNGSKLQNRQSGTPHALQPSPPYGSLGISKHRVSVSVSPSHSHPSG